MSARLRYTVLPVADVAVSVAFYQTIGTELRTRDGEQWADVSSDKVAVSLCGPSDPKRPPEPAFAVTVDNLGAALEHAAAAGGVLEGEPGADSAYLRDPDGHLVMLIAVPG